MSARRVICASARAFASPTKQGGGNPVSIFLPSFATSSDERTNLAKTVEWESIVIESNNSEDKLPTFHFYMPSGEEVSFCGHAAIGACSFLANKQDLISAAENNNKSSILLQSDRNTTKPNSNNTSILQSDRNTTIPFTTAQDGLRYDAKVSGNEIELVMDTQHYETDCTNSQANSLDDLLREIGLNISDVPPKSKDENDTCWPTFINSDVARAKTLIPIETTELLHSALPPKDPNKWRELCDGIESTGIYLYSTFTAEVNDKNIVFESRQFPRASGYPEDPATGIAAGALAASLYKRNIMINKSGTYNVYQGTSMGKPSKICVQIDNFKANESNPKSLRISYSGLVVFDSVQFI